MSKKLNEAFLAAYTRLDEVCIETFGIAGEGVTEYINKLGTVKGGYKRDQMLANLVRYRAIKNELERKIEHGTSPKLKAIKNGDIMRIRRFSSDICRGRDPLSLTLNKANRTKSQLHNRILSIILPIILVFLVAGIVTVLCLLLIK